MGKNTKINMNEVGLSVDVENTLTQLKWQDLLAPPMFHISFFGQIVTLKTANKNYVYTMLAYRSKRIEKANGEQFWVLANIQRLDALLATIEKITCNQYIRHSNVKRIQLAVNQELKRWSPWINKSQALPMVAKKLQLLSSYHQWQEQDVAECRERYIKQQLQIHQTFFDNVESNPLTINYYHCR